MAAERCGLAARAALLLALLLAAAAPARAQPGRSEPAPPASDAWIAVYAALAPGAAFGMSAPQTDRLMAHAEAETLCRAGPGGGSCRRMLEVGRGCAALVQGVRDLRPLRFGTAPPESLARLPVALVLAAEGAGREQAEGEALARCAARERGLLCRVVASGCVPG
ncbi:DUF4189 domain-containing protein [Rubritepida flocculans]|uniref:DUF4189 domain-containing protein n=1 Tax=Rubritepida flocculans TaxID=182403 RepID=UPI0003F7E5AC|nr:DUF4189 domain-containing protein [Rubritepida flocculans]